MHVFKRILVRPWLLPALALGIFAICACDDDGPEADRLGVGSECTRDGECPASASHCLAFKGGYCGVPNCGDDTACPTGSACVMHDDGQRYCFRTCTDKLDCNANRRPENEANCSASVDFVGGGKVSGKACVPPSGS